MWITGSPIELPLFNSSFGAAWSDVYVAKSQTAKCQCYVGDAVIQSMFIHNHFTKYETANISQTKLYINVLII